MPLWCAFMTLLWDFREIWAGQEEQFEKYGLIKVKNAHCLGLCDPLSPHPPNAYYIFTLTMYCLSVWLMKRCRTSLILLSISCPGSLPGLSGHFSGVLSNTTSAPCREETLAVPQAQRGAALHPALIRTELLEMQMHSQTGLCVWMVQ